MNPLQPQAAGLPSSTFGGRRRPSAGARPAQHLASAVHRGPFRAGGMLLVLSALWWGAVRLAAATGVDLPWAVQPATAKALLMGLGALPLFLAGVLFNLGPRWLGLAPVRGALMKVPVAAMLGGWLLAGLGFHAALPLAALGLAAAAVGMALVAGLFGLMVLESRAAGLAVDRRHAVVMLLGLAVTVVAQWAAAVALALGRETVALAALQAALWGGLAPVALALALRLLAQLLPAEATAWASGAWLGLLALAVLLQAPLAVGEVLAGGALAPDVAALRAALALPAGAVLLWLSLRWGLRQSLRAPAQPLAALLHGALFWLGVSLTLTGVSQGLLGTSGGTVSLGDAPGLALVMGFLGNALLGLATPVALGATDRALRVDRRVLLMALTLQVGVAAGLAGALWPQAGTALGLLSAQMWLAAMAGWGVLAGRQPQPTGVDAV